MKSEIKESTWERLYKPRMALLLKPAKRPPSARDAKHLLEAQADLWRQRPGCRTRRLQIHYTAALWGLSEGLLPAQWAPPPDLASTIGVFLFGSKGPAVCAISAIPSYLRVQYAPPRPEPSSPSREWLNSNAQLFRTNNAARAK